ncbi:hypothetical protein ATCC90586_005617 [Pythium insidiosum]|nr:hypothetical protein ATCC90586_005617 [Pythium insidiosum]
MRMLRALSISLPTLALLLGAAIASQVLGVAQQETGDAGWLRLPLRRHDVIAPGRLLALQQQRIRRRLGATATDGNGSVEDSDALNDTVGIFYNEVPLGVGYGTHYAELYIGLPPQRASVIVDTGSHLTALPCNACKHCGEHTDPLFDIDKSSTVQYVSCQAQVTCSSCTQQQCLIEQSYTEGSMWTAVMVDDLVWLGGFSGKHAEGILKNYGVRFPFGCQTSETGLFLTQKENGIMGLGRHKATLMSYMVKEKRVAQNIFTMCFSDKGGNLVLGGVDYSQHETKVAYTPLTESYSGCGKGVIVDSGTTDTFFVSSGARAFKSIFSDIAGVDYNEDKMDVSAKSLRKLPNITIVLAGHDGEEDFALEIPPQKYLSKADDGTYYGNFHFSERSGGVLGASTMVGYDVIFDMEKNRVGFAESKCDAVKPKGKSAHGGMNDHETPTSTTPAPSLPARASTPPSVNTDEKATTSSNASSFSSMGFFAQITALSAVGVIGVIAWSRLRNRSWSPLRDSETTRGSPSRQTLDDIEAQSSPSPSRRSPHMDDHDDRDDKRGRRNNATREFLTAAASGDLCYIQAYILSGGDVNATLGERWTALHHAVARRQHHVVAFLVGDRLCDLNLQTSIGTCALEIALERADNISARILLDNGASRSFIGVRCPNLGGHLMDADAVGLLSA